MNPRKTTCLLSTALLLFQAAAATTEAQQLREAEAEAPNVDPKFDKVKRQRWIEFYRRDAASYSFYVGEDRAKKLKLNPEPVLVYTNPVGARGLTHGAVFIWTHEGRSEVVGAMWSHANTPGPNQRTVAHEFHSLSNQPLMAERNDEETWSTRAGTMDWLAVDGASQPAASTVARLSQMRSLARELSVTRHDPRSGARDQLRLLPKPLFRYDRTSLPKSDGAVFAYCVVWDPELFVVIEARETERGLKWFYAPIRFSHLTLAVRQRKKEVWRDVRGGPSHRDPALGYKLFGKTSVQNEVLEDSAQTTR